MSEHKTLCAVFNIEVARIQRMVSDDDKQMGNSSVVQIEAVDVRLSKVSGPANAVMRVIGVLAKNGESGLISVG